MKMNEFEKHMKLREQKQREKPRWKIVNKGDQHLEHTTTFILQTIMHFNNHSFSNTLQLLNWSLTLFTKHFQYLLNLFPLSTPLFTPLLPYHHRRRRSRHHSHRSYYLGHYWVKWWKDRNFRVNGGRWKMGWNQNWRLIWKSTQILRICVWNVTFGLNKTKNSTWENI